MLATDVFHPAEWHDFFVMVGGAAAVLIGLVFVALSLNLGVLLQDPIHRARSIGTLTNFAGVFVISAVALMGRQTHVSIGVVWLGVALAAGFVYIRPWPTTHRLDARSALTTLRFAVGGALYLGIIIGSVLILAGSQSGLYVAASAMTLLTVYSVTGAWLLVTGPRMEQ